MSNRSFAVLVILVFLGTVLYAQPPLNQNGVLDVSGNGYVEVSDNPTLRITDQLTMEAWAQPTQAGSVYRPIVDKNYEDAYGFGTGYVTGQSDSAYVRVVLKNTNYSGPKLPATAHNGLTLL